MWLPLCNWLDISLLFLVRVFTLRKFLVRACWLSLNWLLFHCRLGRPSTCYRLRTFHSSVSISLSNFRVRVSEVIGSRDVNISALILLQVYLNVILHVIDISIGTQLNSTHWIFFNQIQNSIAKSSPNIFKYFNVEGRTTVVLVNFWGLICDRNFALYVACSSDHFRRQEINSLAIVIIAL